MTCVDNDSCFCHTAFHRKKSALIWFLHGFKDTKKGCYFTKTFSFFQKLV